MNRKILLIFLLVKIRFSCGNGVWHRNASFYQIYPRSFKDSNGDGVGDIKGVTSKLSYLQDLKVDGIWLNPILKSPQKDAGYDISNYYEIEPLFGTMEDFEELLREAKKRNIHLIMDFVPNHVSTEHEWFIKSENKDPEYEDYFIWHKGRSNPNGNRPLPPNNWVSVMIGSMWEWSDKRQEYYLHQFLPEQADLNYRNQRVVDEMKNVLKFWLNKGISGFRIDAVMNLFEVAPDADGNLPDEPPSGDCNDPNQHCFYQHIYTQNQSETYDIVKEWRMILDEFASEESKLMMLEVLLPPEDLAKLNLKGADIPFNFEPLYTWKHNVTAKQIKQFAERYMSQIPTGFSPNWVLGNHDNKRLATRLGIGRADLFNILLQTLPGNAVTYNGEEIAMVDVFISWEDTQDPQACATNKSYYQERSRDPARTPFQWNDSRNGGFSVADKCWLPVGNYKEINVEEQLKNKRSHLKIFKKLVELHKLPAFRHGSYKSAKGSDEDLYVYTRSTKDATYLVALNFGNSTKNFNFTKSFGFGFNSFQVIVASVNSDIAEGKVVNADQLEIAPQIGLVMKAGAPRLFHSSIFGSLFGLILMFFK